MVKTTFPSRNKRYTGFKPIEEDPDLHVKTSSSGDDSPLIDLTK